MIVNSTGGWGELIDPFGSGTGTLRAACGLLQLRRLWQQRASLWRLSSAACEWRIHDHVCARGENHYDTTTNYGNLAAAAKRYGATLVAVVTGETECAGGNVTGDL